MRLFSFILNLIILSAFTTSCGPGIPLSPTSPFAVYLSGDKLYTIVVSDPSPAFANQNQSVQYTIASDKELSPALSLSNIELVKTGSAEAQMTLTGSGAQFTLILTNLTGNGLISFNLQMQNQTLNFTHKVVRVDNDPPHAISTVTPPQSTVTSSSALFEWESNDDSTTDFYRVKLCEENNCVTDCGDTDETESTSLTMSNLINGTYYACVQGVDFAGNSSDFEVSTSFTVAIPTTDVSLNANQISLSSPNAGTTSNDSTPIISGNALLVGSQLKIYSDSLCQNLLDDGTVASDGTISLTPTLLSDGSYHFYGKLEKESTSTSCIDLTQSYLLDTTAPDLSLFDSFVLSSPSNGITSSDRTPVVSGNGENGAVVSLYDDSSCTNLLEQIVVTSGTFSSTSISFPLTIEDGTKSFYAVYSDSVGNASNCQSLSLSYLLDTIVPNDPTGWSLTNISSGTTSNIDTPFFSGAGIVNENESLATIYSDSSCDSSLGSDAIAVGSFLVNDISIGSDGLQNFYGDITDSAGNQSSCVSLNLNYYLDTENPTNPSGWTMSSPNSGATSNDETPQIAGSGLAVENGSFVEIYDAVGCVTAIGSATIAGGSFTVTDISYASNGSEDGSKTFYGKITDIAGNSSTCVSLSLGYLLDTTDPSNPSGWTMSSPNSGTTSNDETPQIAGSGLAIENGSLVEIYDASGCVSAIGSATIAGGSFTVADISYATDGSDDGALTFYGKISDVAGNSSSCVSLSLGYLLDTTVPSDPSGWTMSSPNSGTTSSDITPSVAGSGLNSENGGTVSIFDGVGCADPIGGATIAGGSFTVTDISYLNDGTNDGGKTFYGIINDVAGNSSSCVALSLTYLLDTTPPSDPSGWSLSSPSDGTTSSDYTPQISHSGLNSENGTVVTIYDTTPCTTSIGSATIAGGSFTVSNISYASDGSDDGQKTFYGLMTDAAGLTSTCVNLGLDYELSGLPPVVTISTPAVGTIVDELNVSPFTVAGSCSEEGSVVSINVGSGTLTAGPNCTGGSFTADFDFSTLPSGPISIQTSQTNGNGTGIAQLIIPNMVSKYTIKSISNGYWFECATFSNGSVKCWGRNSDGELGLGHTTHLGDNADEMGDNLSFINLGTSVKVRSISTGERQACAILSDYNLKCWGYNFYGLLGLGHGSNMADSVNEVGDNLSTIKLGTDRKAIQVSTGRYITCALLDNLTAKCWGNGNIGQLGQGNTTDMIGRAANQMGDNLSTINLGTGRYALSVSPGGFNGCALLDGGEAKCFGSDSDFGTLGQGNTLDLGDGPDEMGDNISVINFGTNLKVREMRSSYYHNCVLLDDSQVKCWGYGGFGELGLDIGGAVVGDEVGEMGDNLSTINFGTNRKVVKMVTPRLHGKGGCALLDNATIKCWGDNNGNLGQGHTQRVADGANEMGNNLSTINVGTNRRVVDFSPGDSTCVLLDDATVKCFGNNNYGQLGQGHTTNLGSASNQMGDNLSAINLGLSAHFIKNVYTASVASHNCVVYENGLSKCFGYNAEGQLGLGTAVSNGANESQMGDNLSFVNLGTNKKVLKFALGTWHTCALLESGELKCFGYNGNGALGQGHTSDLGDGSNEMGDNLSTINFGTGRFVLDIFSGGWSSCALLDDQSLKCFGKGTTGELGGVGVNKGDNANEMGDNLPTVNLGTGKKALWASNGDGHTCVILNDLSVKCFGSNSSGQLGQGRASALGTTASQMGDNLSSILLGTGRKALRVSTGYGFSCVLLDNRTIKCFGGNSQGYLGQGHTTNLGDNADEMGDNLSPINLGSNKKAMEISSSDWHTCVLLDDSSIKCFGDGGSGKTGQGHQSDIGDSANEMGDNLSVILLGTNRTVMSVTAGYYHTCVLLDDSSVKCFGGGNVIGLTGSHGDQSNEMGDNLSSLNL